MACTTEMSSSHTQCLLQQCVSDDVDQWSEALLVKPEVSAETVWPREFPGSGSRVLYHNASVSIQVNKDGSGDPMGGSLAILAEDQSPDAWCQWEPAPEHRELGSRYEFRARVSDIHSAKILRPSIGYPQLILNLHNGCSPPPFFFQSGNVMEFRNLLSQLVPLRRGDSNSHTWVNDDSGSQCRYPVHGPKKECQATDYKRSLDQGTPESSKCSDAQTSLLLLDRMNNKVDEAAVWKWRALQGGASVVRGLRKGWAQACHATLDVAAAAADLLDKSNISCEKGSICSSGAGTGESGAGTGESEVDCEHRSSDGGSSDSSNLLSASPPSPLLLPRPGRGDSIASIGSDWEDCVVLVDHEHEPWHARAAVTLTEWNSWLDAEGRLLVTALCSIMILRKRSASFVQNLDRLRHAAYYGGISPQDRAALRASKASEYQGYRRQWMSVTSEQALRFGKFRERKHRIDKDVIRTDRAHPVFASEHGEGLRMLHDILLSYAFYNFDLSYCQVLAVFTSMGMSDLASPLVVVLQDEIDAFWCFQRLMEQVGPNFHKDQNGMHAQLQALHRICKALEPQLLVFLEEKDCAHFYFCFRWLLILFKRELSFVDVQRVWEALWSRMRGPDLHLFLAMAILRRHAPAIIQQKLGFDELLKYINDLALTLPVEELLVEADALYQRYNASASARPLSGTLPSAAPGVVSPAKKQSAVPVA